MQITINGEKLSYTLEEEKTIGEVLGAIEAECKKANETITAVHVDGKEMEAEALDALFIESVDNDYQIDLFTVSGTEIRTYMQELIKELNDCAGLFETIPVHMQTGEDAKALELLERFSEHFTALFRCLLLFDITDIPIDIMIEEKPLEAYQKEITELLQEIIASIEENDIIQAGDLAEYELTPLVSTLVNGISSFLN